MNRKNWHLDIQFRASPFRGVWPDSSSTVLLSLFKHLDGANKPVLSMLPAGVSPAGAAAAAAFYFLPGQTPPPSPICRIALFPGLHFVRQIRQLSLDSGEVWRFSQEARIARRGAASVLGAFERLRKEQLTKIKTQSPDSKDVAFHWVFRCQRAWIDFNTIEGRDLLPRSRYGTGDPYLPCIDFLESEALDRFSDSGNPYDLLIYAPYFHSRSSERSDDDLNRLVANVSKFSAHRKLIVARSPFDYWSQRMEKRLGVRGIAIPSEPPTQQNRDGTRPEISFRNVSQIVDLDEARTLYLEIDRISRGDFHDWVSLNELKFYLRRILVSLDPRTRHGEEPNDEIGRRMIGLAEAIGLSRDGSAMSVIRSIDERIRATTLNVKLEVIRALASEKKSEIWVTRGLDRQILEEAKARLGLNTTIRLMNRWSSPGEREEGSRVILTRIDRESDLDLTAYLKSGDAIVMSTWEMVIRGGSILYSWERSERWIQNAQAAGVLERKSESKIADPVLELAHYLDSASVAEQPKDNKSSDMEATTWWDERDAGSMLETCQQREELLSSTGASTFHSREFHFEGGYGMFVRADDELLTIEEEDLEGEIISAPVESLLAGATVILFQDNERGSIFDVLMDQLERSPEHKSDAQKVREWKRLLRDHVTSKKIKVSELSEQLSMGVRKFEAITVGSWIFGPTMAPMKHEQLARLVYVLGLNQIDTKKLFESVKRLRVIARALGRALNEMIIKKSLDGIDPGIREALQESGIDIDEMSGAIEARRVVHIMPQVVQVEGRSLKKIWKM